MERCILFRCQFHPFSPYCIIVVIDVLVKDIVVPLTVCLGFSTSIGHDKQETNIFFFSNLFLYVVSEPKGCEL